MAKKKNIRSEYIKNLMEDKEALDQQMREVTETTIRSILSETVNDKLKNILKEDEDSYEEEEVEDVNANDGEEEVAVDDVETETSDEGGEEETDVDMTDSEVESPEADGAEADAEAEDDVWGDIEQYKGEDGEYDLTGMDKENLIKVLKVMGPEDGVRVVKNDNGTVTLSDEETDKEYILDIDGDFGCEGGSCDASKEEEDVYEIDFDIDESVNEDNLGYMPKGAQKQTAMTTPDNHEPADSSKTYSMDGGVPTGTENPLGGKGDKAPFDKGVNECGEQPIQETMTTQENGPFNRNTGMYHGNSNKKAARGRNSHEEGKQVKGTGENSYSGDVAESIKRKANEIFRENKQLKEEILPKVMQRLQEAIVINQSLANVVNIMNENATTKEEKKSIMERFNNVKTREESNRLYKQICEELKRNRPTADINNMLNSQLSESKSNNINEKPMYQSKDLNETIEFMERLNKIK